MALVDAKVATVLAVVKGIDDRLRPVADAPEGIARLDERADDLERRVSDLESGERSRATWRRVNLPALLLSVVALASSVTSTLHWLGVF